MTSYIGITGRLGVGWITPLGLPRPVGCQSDAAPRNAGRCPSPRAHFTAQGNKGNKGR